MAVLDRLRSLLVRNGQSFVDLMALEEGVFNNLEGRIRMVSPDPIPFPSGQLFDQFVFDIRMQGIKMRQRTWERIVNYHVNNIALDAYRYRRVQIELEALTLHGMISPDELYKIYAGGTAETATQMEKRDGMVETRIVRALAAIESNAFSVIVDHESPISVKIKDFLRSKVASSILSQVINHEINLSELPQQMEITPETVVNMIKEANIYQCKRFGYLKGCALRDGFLICISELASTDDNGGRAYWADALTLGLHEAAHYCIRKNQDNYGWRSPFSGLGNVKNFRYDSAVDGKLLELGRAAEMAVFGGMQVDWEASTKAAAENFLKRVHDGRLPYESKIICLELGMVETAFPSVSFGGKMISFASFTI